jgi:hypothetical protein
MHMLRDAEARAAESMVLALKQRTHEESALHTEPKSPAPAELRLPLTPETPIDLDKALEEVMTRFCKTLDYLAK